MNSFGYKYIKSNLVVQLFVNILQQKLNSLLRYWTFQKKELVKGGPNGKIIVKK